MSNTIRNQYTGINPVHNQVNVKAGKTEKKVATEHPTVTTEDTVEISDAGTQEADKKHSHEEHNEGSVHKSMETAHKGVEIEHASHAAHGAHAAHGVEAAHHGAEGVHQAGQTAQHAGEAAQHGAKGAQQLGEATQQAGDAVQNCGEAATQAGDLADCLSGTLLGQDINETAQAVGSQATEPAAQTLQNVSASATDTAEAVQQGVHQAGETAQHIGEAVQNTGEAAGVAQAHNIAETAQATGESAGSAAEHISQGASAHTSHAAHAADAADAVDAANAAEAAEAAHDAADLMEGAKASGSLLPAAGAIAGGVVGAYFLPKGIKGLKKSIKEKDTMEAIESGGQVALGTAGLIGFGKFASKAAGGAVEAAMTSPVVSTVAAGLGVVHGAADIVIGGKQIYDGAKLGDKSKIVEGSFNVGIGTSIAAIALGGGLPAAAGLGVAFLGKTVYKNRKGIKNAGRKVGGAISSGARATGRAAKKAGGAIAGAARGTVRIAGNIKNKTVETVKGAVDKLKPKKKEKTEKPEKFVESSTGSTKEAVEKAKFSSLLYSEYLNGTFF